VNTPAKDDVLILGAGAVGLATALALLDAGRGVRDRSTRSRRRRFARQLRHHHAQPCAAAGRARVIGARCAGC
jgi:glycine/D-amino acid oxidase-like deaminating enzyme